MQARAVAGRKPLHGPQNGLGRLALLIGVGRIVDELATHQPLDADLGTSTLDAATSIAAQSSHIVCHLHAARADQASHLVADAWGHSSSSVPASTASRHGRR